VAARGAEESTAWRQPIDLIALCAEAAAELPGLFATRPNSHGWSDHAALAQALLGDDPTAIMDALKAAIRAGAAVTDLGRSFAYAAALRLARFGTANEHADWETAHHVFTYANAVHQMLKQIGTANRNAHIDAVRGVLHGAMALYLARYLNVPPARIPGDDGESLDNLPANADEIRIALLDAFDRQRQVDLAARLVARHLTLGHSVQALIATLARALLREDPGFHAYQVLDAGVRQFGEWGNTDEGRHIAMCGRLRVGKDFLHARELVGAAMCSAFCAVHMTAGHNALRGSGPGQNRAFKDAVALMGCPDRRIDRLCITCCSSSQPSHHTGSV